MKHTAIITILAVTIAFFLAGPTMAMEERTAYELSDGHWIYFGPAPTDAWTAARKMPQSRSLEGSIRGDALRHYEMPDFELAESGRLISFYGRTERSAGTADKDAGRLKAGRPDPALSPWESHELPESGSVIVFPRKEAGPEGDEPAVARYGENRM